MQKIGYLCSSRSDYFKRLQKLLQKADFSYQLILKKKKRKETKKLILQESDLIILF